MKREFVLFTTEVDEDEYLESYNDFNEDDADVTDSRFRNWFYEQIAQEFDDLKMNIRYSKQNRNCVVLGSLGLWNGVHEIVPKTFNDIESAINKCISDCEIVTIKQVDGYIKVSAAHHDGTNNFSIHLLTDEAINDMDDGELCEEDLSNEKYHLKIKNYLF